MNEGDTDGIAVGRIGKSDSGTSQCVPLLGQVILAPAHASFPVASHENVREDAALASMTMSLQTLLAPEHATTQLPPVGHAMLAPLHTPSPVVAVHVSVSDAASLAPTARSLQVSVLEVADASQSTTQCEPAPHV